MIWTQKGGLAYVSLCSLCFLNFDLILVLFCFFLAQMGCVRVQKRFCALLIWLTPFYFLCSLKFYFWPTFGVVFGFFFTPMGFFGEEVRLKTFLGSTQIAEQLLFSMLHWIWLLIMTKFWGHYWLFWTRMGYLSGLGMIKKMLSRSTHVA